METLLDILLVLLVLVGIAFCILLLFGIGYIFYSAFVTPVLPIY